MAFAPFPPATYLSDGARTEGEMKTAFENWLLASRQMEHGQCRLSYVSPTSLQLRPAEGRRVLVNGRPFLVPIGGLGLTNAGLVASTFYYVTLYDEFNDGACVLKAFNATGANVRAVDPDSGVSMMSFDAGASVDLRTTIVGYVVMNAAGQFVPSAVASLHDRRLVATSTALPSDFSTGSATPVQLFGVQALGFVGDGMTVAAFVTLLAATVSNVTIQAFNESVASHWVSVTVPASQGLVVPLIWAREALPTDQGWFIEVRVSVSSGGPVTFGASSALTLTRVA